LRQAARRSRPISLLVEIVQSEAQLMPGMHNPITKEMTMKTLRKIMVALALAGTILTVAAPSFGTAYAQSGSVSDPGYGYGTLW
jgi:hypothetical protein